MWALHIVRCIIVIDRVWSNLGGFGKQTHARPTSHLGPSNIRYLHIKSRSVHICASSNRFRHIIFGNIDL